MKSYSLFILCALITLPLAAQPKGMTPPTAQADAPIWLEVLIKSVETTPADEGAKDISAKAVILNTYKGPESLRAGDHITIQYTYDAKPMLDGKTKRPVGPSSPPMLREGRNTYAFLAKAEGEDVYRPAASTWSFAPPFGVPAEERKKLGMKTPKPPSTPPPPPPNFQVPMKTPAPPAMSAPKMPPPPPPSEQQIEEGDQ